MKKLSQTEAKLKKSVAHKKNRVTSLKQTQLFFVNFLEYLPLFLNYNVHEESA